MTPTPATPLCFTARSDLATHPRQNERHVYVYGETQRLDAESVVTR